eukprot:jgi/Ulvmu1/7444/UM036_0106.1
MLSTSEGHHREAEAGQGPAGVWVPALATLNEPGTPGIVAKITDLSTAPKLPSELRPLQVAVSNACATLSPLLVNIGSVLHVCLMVPGASANDVSASIMGDSTICFVVHRRAHCRLSTLLGKTAEFQTVTFNPLALSDQKMHITIRLPRDTHTPVNGSAMRLEYIQGFFVARLNFGEAKVYINNLNERQSCDSSPERQCSRGSGEEQTKSIHQRSVF